MTIMSGYLSTKAKWQRNNLLSIILMFIESIIDHVEAAEVCDWGSDDDFVALSVPKSVTNPVARKVSVLMNTHSGTNSWVPTKGQPWKLTENSDPVFVAALIALNFHLIDQEPELIEQIDLHSSSYPWFGRFGRLKKHLQTITNTTSLKLEKASNVLFTEYKQRVFDRSSGWNFLKNKLDCMTDMLQQLRVEFDEADQESENKQMDQLVSQEGFFGEEYSEHRDKIQRVQRDPVLRVRD